MKLIISVDHGNKQTKTKHRVFTSGIVESDTRPAFGSDILKYKEKYYTVSDKRISYERNKMLDERFYILTLFAIAHELEFANIDSSNQIINIQLLVGLPPAHFGSLSEKFEKHFVRGVVETLEFHGKHYKIFISGAYAFPQAYAATMLIRQDIETYPKCAIIDIGGFTADYLAMRYGEMDPSLFGSLENGVFFLYNPIIERVNSDFDILLTESDIDDIILGRQSEFPANVCRIVRNGAQTFINDLISKLRERSIDLRTGKSVFVGGGSILLKKQIESSDKIGNPIFIDRVTANAEGYEMLYDYFIRQQEGV